MSSISTCLASSFSVRVFSRDAVVTPDVLAAAVAWVSVSAAEGAAPLLMVAALWGLGLEKEKERSL